MGWGKWTNEWTNGPNGWTNGPNGWTNGPNGWTNGPNGWTNEWTNGPNGWTNEWTNGPNGWTNEWINGPNGVSGRAPCPVRRAVPPVHPLVDPHADDFAHSVLFCTRNIVSIRGQGVVRVQRVRESTDPGQRLLHDDGGIGVGAPVRRGQRTRALDWETGDANLDEDGMPLRRNGNGWNTHARTHTHTLKKNKVDAVSKAQNFVETRWGLVVVY